MCNFQYGERVWDESCAKQSIGSWTLRVGERRCDNIDAAQVFFGCGMFVLGGKRILAMEDGFRFFSGFPE
jgi:hypothetical protein